MTGRARAAGCLGRGCQVLRITIANWLLWNERDRATFSHPRVSGLYLTSRGRIKCQLGWKGKKTKTKQTTTNNNKQSENLSLSRGGSVLSTLWPMPTLRAGRHRQPWQHERTKGVSPLKTNTSAADHLFWVLRNTAHWIGRIQVLGSITLSCFLCWMSQGQKHPSKHMGPLQDPALFEDAWKPAWASTIWIQQRRHLPSAKPECQKLAEETRQQGIKTALVAPHLLCWEVKELSLRCHIFALQVFITLLPSTRKLLFSPGSLFLLLLPNKKKKSKFRKAKLLQETKSIISKCKVLLSSLKQSIPDLAASLSLKPCFSKSRRTLQMESFVLRQFSPLQRHYTVWHYWVRTPYSGWDGYFGFFILTADQKNPENPTRRWHIQISFIQAGRSVFKPSLLRRSWKY